MSVARRHLISGEVGRGTFVLASSHEAALFALKTADPPAVIPIDLGRQLFVDDFLIEESSLARTFHRAAYHPASPLLRPTTPWEMRDEMADRTGKKPNPTAMTFSDGVVFDPKDRLFKMWYMAGYGMNTCLATSHDGITWDRLLRESSVTYPCDAEDQPGRDIVFGDGFPTRSGRARSKSLPCRP